MASSTFPAVPSEMTTAWLSQTLNADVVDFAIEPVSVGVGFAGSVYRVRIALRSAAQETVIWKIASTHPPTHQLLMEHRAYEREAGFYTALAPRVSSASKPYFSEYDAESGALCILTEDLGELEAGDQVGGCTRAQARAAVDGMAALHAEFWSDELPVVSRHDHAAEAMAQMHSASWRQMRLAGLRGLHMPPELLDAADLIAPNVVSIKQRLAKPPITLQHGDMRLDNMFFEPEGGVRLIDWQIIRAGRGAYDLAYFLATSLPTESRREWQSELIRGYVDALKARGVVGYNEETCIEDIRWSLLDLVTFTGIIGATLDLGQERGLQLAEMWVARLWATVADTRALELIE